MRTDRDVSRLLDGIHQIGLDRNTAIVLTADHGEALGEHGHFYHGLSLNETEVLVPLWIWIYDGNGELIPLELPNQVPTRDLNALLCGLIGVKPPAGLANATLLMSPGYSFSVVHGDFKLIRHWGDKFEELYNLREDPREVHNQIDARPREREILREKLGREIFPMLPRRARSKQ